MSEHVTVGPGARRASVGAWVALVVAAGCTVYEVLAGALVEWTGLGFVPLLFVPPLYIAAILLLIWVGQQGFRVLRTLAIVVGIVLAVSLPVAVVVAVRTWS
ncbi:hypothetical protein C1N91_05655 [Curtobacterium sp. SGAir0471]|uniref:hypothetical protein n=1 Tax=Curtobacterium sp. SGAir0471 TaxID=2070337 RepID=UPI0010CD5160|nr:hypothetical protein [Curtobacterium sp. SGAir0471]QCR43106.1 hypothetical protein C1N91_05655 [Curtobacterium sp. SGAir0471]